MLVFSLILIGICVASAVSMSISPQGTDRAKLEALPGMFAMLLLGAQAIMSNPAGLLHDPGRLILVVACTGVVILLYLQAEAKAVPDHSETAEWTINTNDCLHLKCDQITISEEEDAWCVDCLCGITADQVKEASRASIAARVKVDYNSQKSLDQDELETSGCWWVDKPLRLLHGVQVNTRVCGVRQELNGLQVAVRYDNLQVNRSLGELKERHLLLFQALLEFVYAHQFDEQLNDLTLFGDLGVSRNGYLFIKVSAEKHLTRRQADAVAELIDHILGELKRQDSLVDFQAAQ